MVLVQNSDSQVLYRYLLETLGVQYLPRRLAAEPIQNHNVVWQRPGFVPQVIFFNQDALTRMAEPEILDLYTKITKAMNLELAKVWYVDAQNRSFMDFLNWLKTQNFVAPLVVMKNDPDIQNYIQNAGSFNWVECFSLQAMLEKTSLKKPTWEVLKLLLESK